VRDVGLVVFDLDGTLVDSSADLATAVNEALDRFGRAQPPLSHEQVRSFIGSGARILVARSLEAAGVALPVEEVLPTFLECYRRRLLDTTRLYPGVREALDRLRDRPLAVLTNKPGDMSRVILRGLDVEGRFFRVYGGGDLPERKPSPLGLTRLMDEAAVPAARALMVGDSAIDVATGRAAGVRTAGVLYGFDRSGVEAAEPDALLASLPELASLLGA
jgi:phosphoglycolate phosphatase